MEIGNNIWLFPSSTQNRKKTRGIYQLILAPLTIVNDALLNDIFILIQKVLELSLGFNRIPIPFGLFIFYLEKNLNYLIIFINYLWFFILINFINIEINNKCGNIQIFFKFYIEISQKYN